MSLAQKQAQTKALVKKTLEEIGFNLPERERIKATKTTSVRIEPQGALRVTHAIDTFVDDAAARMEVVGEPDTILPVMQEVQAEVTAADGPTMIGIERYAFYERAKQAYAVIQTGERRFYGCFALRKGVIPPDEG